MDAHFTSIVMEGISMSEQFKTKSLSFITDRHVGIITAIRDGEGFTFWLEINALRDEDVVPWRDSVEACLSNQISEWVQKKQELPETAPQEPSQLFLGFDIEKGKCISACHEVSRK